MTLFLLAVAFDSSPVLKHCKSFILIQEVLGKFEFFPIKCKVLLARENRLRYLKDLQYDADFWGSKKRPKTKVRNKKWWRGYWWQMRA